LLTKDVEVGPKALGRVPEGRISFLVFVNGRQRREPAPMGRQEKEGSGDSSGLWERAAGGEGRQKRRLLMNICAGLGGIGGRNLVGS
jgi:hypothetical protein